MSSIFQESCVTLAYLESWYIQNLRNIENPLKHLWFNVFLMNHGIYTVKYFTQNLSKYDIYRLLAQSKLKHIQNSTYSRYCKSLKYSLHRILSNLDIFTTYVYLSPSTLRTRWIWWVVFYRTLCDTGIFRTRGILQTLSNIYYGEFYSESCVTLAYLKPWHIQNQRHILSNIYHKIFYLSSSVRSFRTRVCHLLLNPFHGTGLFLYLPKT